MSTQVYACNPITLLAPAQTQTHQKRDAVITYSQPPLPLIRSGRLTGQTMYNSEIWPKIVLFELSLLARGGGAAGAAKGVGTVTSALVKTLESASCCRCLGRTWERGGLQGSLSKLRGPFISFPHSYPHILHPGEIGFPEGQLGEHWGQLHCPHPATHTDWGLESHPHVSGSLTLPRGPW